MSQRVLFGVLCVLVLGTLTVPAVAATFPPTGVDHFADTKMTFERPEFKWSP